MNIHICTCRSGYIPKFQSTFWQLENRRNIFAIQPTCVDVDCAIQAAVGSAEGRTYTTDCVDIKLIRLLGFPNAISNGIQLKVPTQNKRGYNTPFLTVNLTRKGGRRAKRMCAMAFTAQVNFAKSQLSYYYCYLAFICTLVRVCVYVCV